MIWLTAYDESRAIRAVKRGHVSPSEKNSKPHLILISSFRDVVSQSIFFSFLLAQPNGRHQATQNTF